MNAVFLFFSFFSLFFPFFFRFRGSACVNHVESTHISPKLINNNNRNLFPCTKIWRQNRRTAAAFSGCLIWIQRIKLIDLGSPVKLTDNYFFMLLSILLQLVHLLDPTATVFSVIPLPHTHLRSTHLFCRIAKDLKIIHKLFFNVGILSNESLCAMSTSGYLGLTVY